MRIPDPLIVGAGPAGCAAAIALARSGSACVLVDRDAHVGDPLCGGFLSWRTVEQLTALGIDVAALGAHRVSRLRLFDGTREADVALPHAAWGLSRNTLDTAMRRRAVSLGADMRFDTVKNIEGASAFGNRDAYEGSALFLASGKHDVRGHTRPRSAKNAALGLRLRLPPTPARTRMLEDAIELHLFEGGYAGIVLQEGGSANICLALRKSALAGADRTPEALFSWLAARSTAFAARLGGDWQSARIDTIGAVPYGFIAHTTEDRVYRLGDQAAVIPSLAGEGISIALASGVCAAGSYARGETASEYQAAFAAMARKPVRLASFAWHLAEAGLGARAVIAIARIAPSLVASLADMARIEAPPSLAPA